MPEDGETPSTAAAAAASVDRCPWNWRQVEVLCAVGAAITASSEHGDKETADLFRATAAEYGRRAKEMETSGKWVPGRAGDPVVEESIKWRCRQSAGEGPAGKSIWERYTEVRREVVNHILPITKKYLTSDGKLPKDKDWAYVQKVTKNDYWKARRGAPAAKKDRPLPLDWNPPAWTVFVEYGPPGADVPQLQEDSVAGPGRKKRKSLASANGKGPVDAPPPSAAASGPGAREGGDPWQGVKTRHGFKADEIISALQKEIRRANLENAMLIAYEMATTSKELEAKLWQRLRVICVEDIGFGDVQAPIMLNTLYSFRKESDYRDGDVLLFVAHAVRYLCAAQKDRGTDELIICTKHAVENEKKLPEIPPYAIDMHTAAGQAQGKDMMHFMEECTVLNPEMEERDMSFRDRIMAALTENPRAFG